MKPILPIIAFSLVLVTLNATSQPTCQYEYTNFLGAKGLYHGECKNDLPNGDGLVEFYNGDVLAGAFEEGKHHGYGTLRYAAGEVWEGFSRQGKAHGHGKFSYPNGAVFEGQYRDGVPNGPGVYGTADGYTLSGKFVEGSVTGTGFQIFPNGDRYDGDYVDGRREGMATYTSSTGDQYFGEFKNEMMSGEGRLVFTNGHEYSGIWQGNEILELTSCPTIEPCAWYDVESEYESGVMMHCPAVQNLQDWNRCSDDLINRKIGDSWLIHIYTRLNNTKAVRTLVEFGADVNALNGSGETALHLAVGSGNNELALFLLKNKADANLVDMEFRQTPLMLSALAASDEVFNELLDATHNINESDLSGTTILHVLSVGPEGLLRGIDIMTGNFNGEGVGIAEDAPEMLKVYMQKVMKGISVEDGAHLSEMASGKADSFRHRFDEVLRLKPDVNIMNLSGGTPLHNAVSGRNLQAVKKLIENKALVNASDIQGRSPLYVISGDGPEIAESLEIARYLIEHGADPHSVTNTGATPLHTAAWKGNVAMGQLLLESGANPHARDSAGYTPLVNAVERGQLDMAKLLIEAEARVDERVNSGETALLIASQNDNSSLVEYLLAVGADSSVADEKGATALHGAAGRGLADIVALLLNAGASVSANSPTLGTPLQSAMWGRIGKLRQIRQLESQPANLDKLETLNRVVGTEDEYRRVTDLLLSPGADTEVEASGVTPLHAAAAQGYIYGARRLIELGAEVEAVDDRQWNALHFLANESGSLIIADMLVTTGTKVDAVTLPGSGQRASTPLGFAASRGHARLAELLLEKGAMVDSRNELQATPLHRAVNGNHVAVIEVLLDNSADIEARDNQGGTTLHVAAGMGNLDSVKVLLEYGAEVDAPGPLPQLATPLHLAAYKGNEQIVKVLLEGGANKNTLTLQGDSAIDIARQRSNTGIVRALSQ
jgi:ankyrin repeat protein